MVSLCRSTALLAVYLLKAKIRDRQVSLSTGTPMIINDLDCDIEPLDLEDFPQESQETAKYVMLQAELNLTGKHAAPDYPCSI